MQRNDKRVKADESNEITNNNAYDNDDVLSKMSNLGFICWIHLFVPKNGTWYIWLDYMYSNVNY